MKHGIIIKIRSEPYGIQPAPKLTKAMFNWFWANFYKVKNGTGISFGEFWKIDIRINQAIFHMPYHFYITINDSIETHIEAYDYDFVKNLEKKKELAVEFDEEYASRRYDFYHWTGYKKPLITISEEIKKSYED